MKHALNKTFKLTRNRKLILLNFALLVLITTLVGLITDTMSGATIACIVSCIALRIIFGLKNQRDFGDSKTIVAANGKTFTLTHKRIVEGVMWTSLVGCWCFAAVLDFPHASDFLPHIIGLFSFQFIVKSMLFIMDLPIATFNVDQRKVDHSQATQPYQSSIIGNSNDMYFSPSYSSLSCNSYNRGR